MSRIECARVLASSRVARLACARQNQPYVVPVSLAYDDTFGCLYGFTTVGQKLEWMRANPLVCVEVDEVTANDRWVSVIATGHFAELPKTAGCGPDSHHSPGRPRQAREAAPARPVGGHPLRGDEVLGEDEGAVNWDRAWQVLKTHPGWWQPGCTAWATRVHRNTAEPYDPVYYRIRIDGVTGHEATREARDEIAHRGAVPAGGRWGWSGRILRRVFGRRSTGPGTSS